MFKPIYFLLLVLAISSCKNYYKHGYMFEYSDSKLLERNMSSSQVLALMGSPTFISDIENEKWYYLNEQLSSFLFFKPKIIKREILIIEYVNNNVVDIANLSLDDQAKKFVFNPKQTAVDDHKSNFFSKLFSNVGQVKPQ